MATSLASSSSSSWNYDVFLSFRGEDTRTTFVDHLYSALNQQLVHTYRDDEALPRGESIGPSLLKAIEESKIAVVVFSQNYANSSWCLDELAHIMKCKDERELIVMPVFYDVDPSDVRKQKRKFEEAFAKHEVENITKTESWRKALVDASNIAGWEPKKTANGHESAVIKRIVDTILDRLLSLNSEVDKELVGMDIRLQDLKRRLKVGLDGVCMVGIWGIGGSGKTTLATSICMEISHHFKFHYIVENIREEARKLGLKDLQKKILSAGFKSIIKVKSVAEGKSHLKRMFHHSNVLLVLDDVDHVGQLEALAGSHNWFGSGSRIIITTRDRHLLETHKVDEVCPVALLSIEEAIQLFNKGAYNEKRPVRNYETLSLSVISYAAGLPLALKVLGSFLYDKDEEEWLSTLTRLKDIPEMEIVEKLKISYDGLKFVEKDLFLDIACFFRWRYINVAIEIFEACGYHPHIGIKVLIQKGLINIIDGKFAMHDLVQEMGHYIVRGKHPHNPKKHSRVWKREEINDMCFGDATMENDKIQAIYHTTSTPDEGSRLTKYLSTMKNLRWLSLDIPYTMYDEGLNFLSSELRYINWRRYPASSFPHSFEPAMLVVLRLHNSCQKELWNSNKRLPNLKVLELKDMKKLLSTPDFDGLPRLQKLTLSGCEELVELHSSLGSHGSVEYVKVWYCRKLRMFPTIVRMKQLNTLEIRSCDAIVDFPVIQANLESLVTLSLELKRIKVLPSSIGVHCTKLFSLRLVSFFSLKSIEFNFYDLKHLKEFVLADYTRPKMPAAYLNTRLSCDLQKLILDGCHLKDGEIPFDIGELSHLQELNLSGNDFTRLEFNLLQLTRLKVLKLNHCGRLVELPELPSNLAILHANDCSSLTIIRNRYINCKWLCDVSLTRGGLVIGSSRLLEAMLQGNTMENHPALLLLDGLEIAKEFRPALVRGSRYRLKLEETWCNDFSGFLLCAVFTRNQSINYVQPRITMWKEEMSVTDSRDGVVWEESDRDKTTAVWYVPFASLSRTKWWDATCKAVLFSFNGPYINQEACVSIGVRMIARKTDSGLTESSSRTPQQHPDCSPYIPKLVFRLDSTGHLEICLSPSNIDWVTRDGYGENMLEG